MNRKQLLIIAGVVVLGLLAAFPLTWLLRPTGSVAPPNSKRASGSRGYGPAIHQTDANGADWAITPMAGQASPADRTDTQTKPSLIVRTEVNQQSDRTLLIGLILEDRAGQRYQPAVVKNGVRQPAPKLRIVDEAGKVILDGNFQYG